MKRKLFILCIMSMFLLIKGNNSAYAYNDENYVEAGIDFMSIQYMNKNISYDELYEYESRYLYDYSDKIIGKLLVLKRDNEFDYVILDYVCDDVNGFGLGEEEYVRNVLSKNKLYYLGQSTLAYYEYGKYYDFNGNNISFDEIKKLNLMMEKTTPKSVESGYDGILSWSEIVDRYDDEGKLKYGYSNCDWRYLTGFTWNGIYNEFSFESQTTFNNNYNRTHSTPISGTCSITAMTNMAIFFNYTGRKALIENRQNTFEWFLNDTSWFNWHNGVNWDDATNQSFRNYADHIGYNYDLTINNNPSFDDFKQQISNNSPIYTYICADQNNGTSWAHAVVSVGYEQFEYSYTTREKSYWFFGWHYKDVNHKKYYNYLRVIDGWSTSNSSRYVDCNNFYSTIMLKSFNLKEKK